MASSGVLFLETGHALQLKPFSIYIYIDKQSTGQKLTTTVKKEQNKSGQNPTAMRIWDVGFCIYFQDGADVQKPT